MLPPAAAAFGCRGEPMVAVPRGAERLLGLASMLRRDPTRIELRNEDLAEFEKLREEYLEKQEASKSRSKETLHISKHTPGPPPPTPASASSGRQPRGGGAGSSREIGVDAIERAGRERRAKTARERIGAS
ncbi:hypothetical protein BGZ73_007739 [Actinomortierella ambigua]|nr:hypothetical protein BGZ73_007739 [Actinomortierella ambigua]